MSRKDYIAIARAINLVRKRLRRCYEGIGATDALSEEIANVMAANNPRFNRERFLDACREGAYEELVSEREG